MFCRKNNCLIDGENGKTYFVALLVLVIVGSILRIIGLNNATLSYDELSAIGRLNFSSIPELVRNGIIIDGHPAGVQIFLWFWSKLFGTSAIAIRFPFVVMGICCIPLMYVVACEWFNKNAGLFAAAMVAVSQYTVYYSLIARPYIFGLFFILLTLYFWSRIIFGHDYSWKNVILFGVFASCSAYSHQFSIMVAGIIGVVGLFFLDRQFIYRYLIGAFIAIIFFIPHLPITYYQLTELKGVGGWLGAPRPNFITQYFQYITHFSYITAAIVVICIVIASECNADYIRRTYKKSVLAFILFAIPFVIGYAYSILVDPVLQFSCLIFSFPFLILMLCSLINDNLSTYKIASLLVYCIVMIVSLIFVRQHYTMITKWGIGTTVKNLVEYNKIYGENNVCGLINLSDKILEYYENEIGSRIVNKYKGYDLDSLYNQLNNEESNYLMASYLDDRELHVIKHFYPYTVECIDCIGTEIYLMSKTETPDCIKPPKVLFERTYNFEQYDDEQEFTPLLDTSFSSLSPSRFAKIEIEMSFVTKDSLDDYLLVLQAKKLRKRCDWNSVNARKFSIAENDSVRTVYLPLRYEVMIKDSHLASLYSIQMYLWNIHRTKSVKPTSVRIRMTPDNRYVYSFLEDIR